MSTRKRDDELERERNIERRINRVYRKRRTSTKISDSGIEEEIVDKRDEIKELQRSISTLNNEISEPMRKVNRLGDKITSLPSRVSKVRDSGYKSLVYLDEAQKHLYEKWTENETIIRNDVSRRTEEIRDRLNRIERELSRAGYLERYNSGSLEYPIESIQSDVKNLENHTERLLQKYHNTYNDIEEDLRIAEQTVEVLASSSFDWKNGEHPLLAVEAEDLDKDIKGYIILTNHRFIFEKEEEIALKKTWFIVTEKKKVRSVVLERPIGSLDDILRGSVGLLKGAGVYINFKKGIKEEIKFDTRGRDADRLIRFFKFIMSGEAEKELEMEEEVKEGRDKVPITCSYCSAPYQDEVYRGQTSLKCKYCGSVIHL